MTNSDIVGLPLGIERTIIGRIGIDFDGECHLTEAEARQAADTILTLKAENDALREAAELGLEYTIEAADAAQQAAVFDNAMRDIRRIEAVLNPSASISSPSDTV